MARALCPPFEQAGSFEPASFEPARNTVKDWTDTCGFPTLHLLAEFAAGTCGGSLVFVATIAETEIHSR